MSSFTRRPETNRRRFGPADYLLSVIFTVGGNNASQPARNFFHHAFFCEGHPKVRAAAAVSAAPAPVHLLLRSLRRAVAARSFPKQAVGLSLAAFLHAGREGQPEPHQLRRVGKRGEDVVHQHAGGAGAAGGVRSAAGDVRQPEPPRRAPAGDRAGGPGQQ